MQHQHADHSNNVATDAIDVSCSFRLVAHSWIVFCRLLAVCHAVHRVLGHDCLILPFWWCFYSCIRDVLFHRLLSQFGNRLLRDAHRETLCCRISYAFGMRVVTHWVWPDIILEEKRHVIHLAAFQRPPFSKPQEKPVRPIAFSLGLFFNFFSCRTLSNAHCISFFKGHRDHVFFPCRRGTIDNHVAFVIEGNPLGEAELVEERILVEMKIDSESALTVFVFPDCDLKSSHRLCSLISIKYKICTFVKYCKISRSSVVRRGDKKG